MRAMGSLSQKYDLLLSGLGHEGIEVTRTAGEWNDGVVKELCSGLHAGRGLRS